MDIDPSGSMMVKVVLDLGFGVYYTLKASLFGLRINPSEDHRAIAKDFAEQWCLARQEQGCLMCESKRLIASNDWTVKLWHYDTEPARHRGARYQLAQALALEGLAKQTS